MDKDWNPVTSRDSGMEVEKVGKAEKTLVVRSINLGYHMALRSEEQSCST